MVNLVKMQLIGHWLTKLSPAKIWLKDERIKCKQYALSTGRIEIVSSIYLGVPLYSNAKGWVA
jgi:hypothetical protein